MLKGLQKRPYQDKAVAFLLDANGRGAVRAPTGAGKTIIALEAVQQIGFKRLLVLVPRYSALLTWMQAIERTGFVQQDQVAVVQKWKASDREALWTSPEPRVVIALYQTIIRDVEHIVAQGTGDEAEESAFDVVVCDESHRIKNRDTDTYKAVKRICRRRRRIFLTATPQSKGPQDLWTTLNLLSPKVFTSYWKFVNRYCVVEDGEYGKDIIGVRRSTLPELKSRLYGFVHSIPEKEIDGWVPKRNRQLLPVEPDKKVLRIYKSLESELLATLPDNTHVLVPNTLAKFTALRQLLCCPTLVHPALGVGEGFKAAIEHAENNDPHVVIFSDFPSAFPIWEAFLRKRKVPTYTLRGGMKVQDIAATIGAFERHKNDEKLSVMLCSTPFAESFDIISSSTGYHVGYAWSQIANYQAEGRLTRGSKSHCNFFYVCHSKTIDTYMLEVLDNKVRTTNITMRDLNEALQN